MMQFLKHKAQINYTPKFHLSNFDETRTVPDKPNLMGLFGNLEVKSWNTLRRWPGF